MRSKPKSLVNIMTIVFSGVSFLLCILFVSIFYSSYYYFADQELKNTLTETANQLNQDYFVYVDGEIKYIQDDGMVGITDLLKSRDLSAVIFNPQGERIGTFGVYRIIYDTPSSPDNQVDNITLTGDQPTFGHIDILDSTYETYTTPLKYEDEPIGYLQVAKQYSLIRKMRSLNFMLILVVLPPILLLISFFTRYLLTKFLAPFTGISEVFSVVSVDKFPKKLSTDSNFTEIQSLVLASNNMIERLKDGIEGQRHFAAYASHEINTPLTRVITDLEVLNLKDKIDVEHNIQDLHHLSDLLDGLLFLLQPSNSVSDKQSDLVVEIDRVLSKLPKRSKVEVNKSLPDKLITPIHPAHAYMLLNNIIKNAFKYTKEGKISITLEPQNDEGFVFEVADTGTGISTDDIALIFEPFFRGETSEYFPGIGVGLSLVKQITNFYGMEVLFTSEENEGTKVRISFTS